MASPVVQVKWYRRPFGVLALLVFVPVLGMPLVWACSSWKRTTKVRLTVAGCLWLLLLLWEVRTPETSTAEARNESRSTLSVTPIQGPTVTPIEEVTTATGSATAHGSGAPSEPPPAIDVHAAVGSGSAVGHTVSPGQRPRDLDESARLLLSTIRKVGITSDDVATVSPDPLGERDVIITLGPTWFRTVKHERLMAAQNLWQAWAMIVSPKDPDAAHITLRDANGNKVGGSGIMGSSIDVDDD